jgi:type IV secretory pathway TraG/TraD family ATPase VirD4
METQLYYGQSGIDTSEYIEKRMGRKSEYAHSKTMHGHEEASAGETEQAVSLMTVQDITELSKPRLSVCIGTLNRFGPRAWIGGNFPI